MDGERGDERNRQHDDQHAEARTDVEDALARQAKEIAAKALRKDEPARMDEVDADPAAFALDEGQHVRDMDAAQPALEELPGGKALSPVVHRDDDLLDLVPDRDAHELRRRLHRERARDARRIARRANVADDAKAALVGAPAKPLGNARRALPCAPYQQTSLEHLLVDDVEKEVARERQAAEREAADEQRHAAADEERRNGIKQERESDLGERGRHDEPHEHAAEAGTLVQLVEPERCEAQQKDGCRDECARRDCRPIHACHREAIAVEANQDRRVDRRHDHRRLGQREKRESVHVSVEEPDRNHTLLPQPAIGERIGAYGGQRCPAHSPAPP